MYILGISAFYHDSAACLLRDETIVAAVQEERFSRIKNDNRFPALSIGFCLHNAGITLHEVDYIVFYEKPFIKFERIIETHLAFAPKGLLSFWKSMPLWMKEKIFQKKLIIRKLQEIDPDWSYNAENLLFTQHHHSHAASAFYPSPFEKALILTLDGVGEWNTTTVAQGSGNAIEFLQEINYPHSIGLLYSAFTYYLGFKVNCDEYKVMGLAPYGTPRFTDSIYAHLMDVKEDGSFRLNMAYFGFSTGLRMTNRKFHMLFGEGPRQKETELTAFHMDIACSIQKVTQEVLLRMVTHLHTRYRNENLCLAGGVALNCVANGKILRESPFKNIWIQPAAGDAGGALGAAYEVYYLYLKNKRTVIKDTDKMNNALLGPSYGKEEIKAVLTKNNLRFTEPDEDQYYKTIASEIANGKIIGWFNGKMEYGPRALGSRSILGDARNPAMQSVMNMKIKFRESFRPFAPVILQEYATEYFDLHTESPYMLLVGFLKEKHRLPIDEKGQYGLSGLDKLKQVRSTVPAIMHVDYSARVQTVNSQSNPSFYRLIKSFHELTGCPMLINTSFNVMDEPIVCSPQDAIACFLRSGIDILAIEGLVVEK